MATIKDVAERAGVSIATVSYVLNNSAPISEETRQRVLKAVRELDYHPSIRGRNLQAGESRIIGYQWYVMPTGEINPLMDRFLYGVTSAADAHGYHVILFNVRPGDVTRAYEDLIRSGRVDGFVLANTDHEDERVRYLIDAGFPFVSFGRAHPDWDFAWVDVDGEAGIRQVMAHLLDNGHRRIAALGWPVRSLAGDSRMQGYFGMMREAGLEVLPAWVVRGIDQVKTGYHAAAGWTALPRAQRPSAIVAMSDNLATGVLNYCSASGIQVGRELAVVGFDDVPQAEYFSPPLSSVRQPVGEIGAVIFDMLLAQLSGAGGPGREPCARYQRLLQPRLVVRASSDFMHRDH
ncbi:MAG: LacI family DNA-binding transcriptional regulator [Anaerolineae bacterium]|nr:LacI family DNA-binding transcriptional regulator [Anaerolineae bacterium]